MTTVTCYDAVTPSNIPADAQAVAGYLNGWYAWKQSDWDRFPNALKKTITITASANVGDVLDVENGDATPQQAPGWIRMRQAADLAKPTIYCSSSVVPQVQQTCAGLNYWIWTAHYTGTPFIEAGSIATQYYSDNYVDKSLCDTAWWSISAQPAPVATPAKTNMTRTPSGNGYYICGSDGGVFCYGDAQFKGSVPGVLKPGQTLAKPVVDIAVHPSNNGYWMVGADGGVFNFGVPQYGNLGNVALAAPINAIEVTPSGNGYWMLGQDGGVFAFGDARFLGAPNK